MIVANTTINLNAKDANGWNALHYAAQFAGFGIFRFLMKYGCPFQMSKMNKVSPLHVAWKHENEAVVEYILSETDSPMIDHPRDNGLTALMYACMKGNAKIVKLLMKHGADPTVKTPNNSTALYFAAKSGSAECIYSVLKNENVNINERWDKSESTPLLAACLSGSVDAVKVLLYQGADHTIRNKNDENALDCAALSDNNRIFLRMIQKFITLNEKEDKTETNKLFNYENKVWGLTLLARLVLEHKFKVAKLLFNSKVQVDYQHSADGDSVLHKAIKKGDKKAIGFCIFIGCDKDLKNNDGDSFNSLAQDPKNEYLKEVERRVRALYFIFNR